MLGDGGLGALIKIDLELMAQNLKTSVDDAKVDAAAYVASY